MEVVGLVEQREPRIGERETFLCEIGRVLTLSGTEAFRIQHTVLSKGIGDGGCLQEWYKQEARA